MRLVHLMKKEKNGPHSQAIKPRLNTLISPQVSLQKQHLYKYLLVNSTLTKPGSHSQVIAPDLRSGTYHRYAGSNSFRQGMEFPPPASIYYLLNSKTHQHKAKYFQAIAG